MSNKELFGPLYVIGVIAFLVFAVWVMLSNYDECRATPHTTMYCITQGP